MLRTTSTSRNDTAAASRSPHVVQVTSNNNNIAVAANGGGGGPTTPTTTTPRKAQQHGGGPPSVTTRSLRDDRSTSYVSRASSVAARHRQNTSSHYDVSMRNNNGNETSTFAVGSRGYLGGGGAGAGGAAGGGNHHSGGGGTGSKSGWAKSGGITFPLSCVLVTECLLVIAVFIILIVVVTVKMTETTRELVEDRITADLRDSRHSIIEPITNFEGLLMAHRLRYISMSREYGGSLCNQKDGNFNASRVYWREALSSVWTHYPLLGWVYAIHLSDEFIVPATGDKQVTLCTASVEYMMCGLNGSLWTTDGPVTVDQTDTFEDVPFTVTPVDVRYDAYIVEALLHTDFGWWPYMWEEPSTGKLHLFIGGFAPMLINKTHANGTIESYIPDLTVPKKNKKEPGLETVSLINVDLMMTHVHTMVREINPPASGAHTSLYDLGTGTLLATSLDGVSPMVNDVMYVAGRGSSPALDRAFAVVNPQKGTPPGDTSVRIIDDDGRIISAIHISTASNLDFLIIQSTPADYYFSSVTLLRTLMIALGVCSAVLIVIVCVVVVITIRRGLTGIQEGMVLAAQLKNDRVRPVSSLMTELNELAIVFGQMNAKLGAARAYMPQSMLLDTDTGEDTVMEEDDEDGAGDGNTTSHRSGTSRNSNQHYPYKDKDFAGSPQKRGNNNIVNNSQLESGYYSSSHEQSRHDPSNPTTVNTRERQLAAVANTMTSKRVTVLVVNTRGFHSGGRAATMMGAAAGGVGIGAADGAEVALLSSELTAVVQSLCAQQRGVIDSFHGDRYVISFNAARHNAQGPSMAVQCGLELAAAFGGGGAGSIGSKRPSRDNNNNNAKVADPKKGGKKAGPPAAGGGGVVTPTSVSSNRLGNFTMGVAAGRALVGHLGSSDLKRFSIVGKVYSRAIALERVCKQAAEEEAVRRYAKQLRSAVIDTYASSRSGVDLSDPALPQPQPHLQPNVFTQMEHPIQLAVEDSLVETLEQTYFMQIIGALRTSAAPNSAAAAAAAAAANAHAQAAGQRQAFGEKGGKGDVFGISPPQPSHNGGMVQIASACSNSNNSAFHTHSASLPQHPAIFTGASNTGNTPLATGAGGAPLPPPPAGFAFDETLVHCVRAKTNTAANDTADEWLYEIKQDVSGAYDRVLPAVNKAIAELLAISTASAATAVNGSGGASDEATRVALFRNTVAQMRAPSAVAVAAPSTQRGNADDVDGGAEMEPMAQLKGSLWGTLALEFAHSILEALPPAASPASSSPPHLMASGATLSTPARCEPEAIPSWLRFRIY